MKIKDKRIKYLELQSRYLEYINTLRYFKESQKDRLSNKIVYQNTTDFQLKLGEKLFPEYTSLLKGWTWNGIKYPGTLYTNKVKIDLNVLFWQTWNK